MDSAGIACPRSALVSENRMRCEFHNLHRCRVEGGLFPQGHRRRKAAEKRCLCKGAQHPLLGLLAPIIDTNKFVLMKYVVKELEAMDSAFPSVGFSQARYPKGNVR